MEEYLPRMPMVLERRGEVEEGGVGRGGSLPPRVKCLPVNLP